MVYFGGRKNAFMLKLYLSRGTDDQMEIIRTTTKKKPKEVEPDVLKQRW